jgi:hypothetical protein
MRDMKASKEQRKIICTIKNVLNSLKMDLSMNANPKMAKSKVMEFINGVVDQNIRAAETKHYKRSNAVKSLADFI